MRAICNVVRGREDEVKELDVAEYPGGYIIYVGSFVVLKVSLRNRGCSRQVRRCGDLALWRNGSPAIASLVNAAIIGPYLNPYHLTPFHTDIDTLPRC
jgi:hypothetical protein